MKLADDAIYIGHWDIDGTKVYSVGHEITENLEYIKSEFTPDSNAMADSINSIWGNGPFFLSRDQAHEYAINKMMPMPWITTHGVIDLDSAFTSQLPKKVVSFLHKKK